MTDELTAHLTSLRIDRTARPPSRSWAKLLTWGGLGAILIGAVFVGKPALEAKIFKTEVTATEIASVSPAQATVELAATGYVQADRASRVAPKVAGRVAKVHVSQGDTVEQDQVLLELDPADERANIQAARSRTAAALAEAQSARAQALVSRAELAEATRRAERERFLANKGATAVAAAEDLEAQVESLRQGLGAVEARAKASEATAAAIAAEIGVLTTGLENLKLVSPISGTILNRPPQLGEHIGPQPPGVTVDMGGIRVADLSTLVVQADIAEARLSQVKVGSPAEIVLDAYPSRRFRGRVKQITPEVDRAKATVLVKVAFEDDTAGVLPDMSARVSLLDKPLDQAMLNAPPKTVVPGSAVVDRGGAKVVFVLDEGRARMVPVEIGPRFGSGFELVKGPAPGTQVVSSPPSSLADGQPIKLAG